VADFLLAPRVQVLRCLEPEFSGELWFMQVKSGLGILCVDFETQRGVVEHQAEEQQQQQQPHRVFRSDLSRSLSFSPPATWSDF
jgi:hypothetical protein